MRKSANSFKLFLCKCTGEDKFILRDSTSTIQNYFAWIGIFVITIFLGCFVSAYVFIYSLFEESLLVSIPVGIVWALVVVNMYLLLLYTVAPPILPQREDDQMKGKSFFTFSMFFRISFITLLAIIVAQPLNVTVFGQKVKSSLTNHVVEEKAKMIAVSDSILIKREADIFKEFNKYIISKGTNHEITEAHRNLIRIETKVNEDIEFMQQSKMIMDSIRFFEDDLWLSKKSIKSRDSLVQVLSTLVDLEIASDHAFISEIDQIEIKNNNFEQEYLKCRNNLKKSVQDKIDNYDNLELLLSRSNFFIKQIQLILYERPWSWILTVAVALLFILPIVFKYEIRNKTNYYNRKQFIEHKIVVEEYEYFKSIYSKILQKNINSYNIKSLNQLQINLGKLEDIHLERFNNLKQHIEEEYKSEIFQKYEYWADNPFRTKKRSTTRQAASETDFLKIIYPPQT